MYCLKSTDQSDDVHSLWLYRSVHPKGQFVFGMKCVCIQIETVFSKFLEANGGRTLIVAIMQARIVSAVQY